MSITDRRGELTGRVAWVTGGAGGIGSAVVRHLAAEGATVAVLDIQDPAADLPAMSVLVDVGDEVAVDAATRRLEVGVGPADIVVHAAGVSAAAPVHEMEETMWHQVLATNLTGPFLLTRRVLGGMIDRRWGRVVSISSSSAVRAGPGTAAYSASKAGLIGFTKAVAYDSAAAGVTANVVAPGIVDTPMTRRVWPTDAQMTEMATSSAIANPMHSVLSPDDIAAAVCYLCSSAAAHVTGQTLHVNGGSVMG